MPAEMPHSTALVNPQCTTVTTAVSSTSTGTWPFLVNTLAARYTCTLVVWGGGDKVLVTCVE